MMIVAYVFLALLPIAAIAYIVWDHKRKVASREAASSGRMEELLVVAQHGPRADPIEPRLGQAPADAAPPPPTFVLRERLMSAPQTLLYYLLKTGLPDYLVLAQVPVGSLLDPAPTLAAYAREEQARMFARHIVDFAILDRSTRPLAVVNLADAGDASRAVSTQMKTWMSAAGVRYVELDSAALPRKEAVRALVLGEETAAAGS